MKKQPKRMEEKNTKRTNSIEKGNSEDYKYGAYERKMERNENRVKKEKKKKHKILKIILAVILIIIILLAGIIGWGYSFIMGKLNKIDTEVIDTSHESIGIDENVAESLSGYRNIALLGIDTRADDYGVGNRSDCIMIASLNEKTNEVKLMSVYRDTYVYVMENGQKRLDKITHAYSYGGAQNTLKSLNEALDLNITEFVTVNFDAVIAAVDALGGITLNIESDELRYVNDYIDDTMKNSGVSSKHLTKTGRQTVDGVQAVAYSRVRYTAGGDYKRTERMRNVVEAMIAKAKTLSLGQLNNFANTILPRISTNMTAGDILSLIPKLASVNINSSIGWPYEVSGATVDGVWYGVPVTLKENVERLHKEVFEQTDYEVSEAVEKMNTAIINKTGYNN